MDPGFRRDDICFFVQIMKPTPETLQRLKAIVGDKGFVVGEADMAPHLVERRELYRGKAAAVLTPASVEEGSACLVYPSYAAQQ